MLIFLLRRADQLWMREKIYWQSSCFSSMGNRA
jgi:hypothetical protein